MIGARRPVMAGFRLTDAPTNHKVRASTSEGCGAMVGAERPEVAGFRLTNAPPKPAKYERSSTASAKANRALQLIGLPLAHELDVHGRRIIQVSAICFPARARASAVASVPSASTPVYQADLRRCGVRCTCSQCCFQYCCRRLRWW